jgi:hypothetical protein
MFVFASRVFFRLQAEELSIINSRRVPSGAACGARDWRSRTAKQDSACREWFSSPGDANCTYDPVIPTVPS